MGKLVNRLIKATNHRYNLFTIIAMEIQKASQGRLITVADFGAGAGKYWAKEPLLSVLQDNVKELYLIDADISNSEVDLIPNLVVNRLNGVVPGVLREFETDFFDVTIALDLIEHLPKDQGYLMLYELDRITKLTSIIFTPNGFVWQPPFEDNPFMAHLSGWDSRDFRLLGWNKVLGLVGPKKIFGPYGMPKVKINFTFNLMQLILLPIIFRLPSFSFAILALKFKKNPRVNNSSENSVKS